MEWTGVNTHTVMTTRAPAVVKKKWSQNNRVGIEQFGGLVSR